MKRCSSASLQSAGAFGHEVRFDPERRKTMTFYEMCLIAALVGLLIVCAVIELEIWHE